MTEYAVGEEPGRHSLEEVKLGVTRAVRERVIELKEPWETYDDYLRRRLGLALSPNGCVRQEHKTKVQGGPKISGYKFSLMEVSDRQEFDLPYDFGDERVKKIDSINRSIARCTKLHNMTFNKLWANDGTLTVVRIA